MAKIQEKISDGEGAAVGRRGSQWAAEVGRPRLGRWRQRAAQPPRQTLYVGTA
jgi:hypothetical protein